MIFSELYSAYYNTIAAIIARVIDGEHSEKELQKIVTERAFGESALTIMPSFKSEKWQLVHSDMTTPLTHRPTMPLTNLQKQWLKAISLDPRVKLFDVTFPDLDDVEPLFTPEDYHIYDKYSDGDPFEDAGYIARFRFLLKAIREQMPIKINMINRNGNKVYTKCIPIRLEYSEKDDKFRLITTGCHFMPTVNLAKIVSCAKYNGEHEISENRAGTRYETVTLHITDERNALERVMLHFAHFEKQTERLDRKHYTVRIRYDYNDEPEIVIRVLSFGPLVKVVEPQRFVDRIRDKLLQQKICGLK